LTNVNVQKQINDLREAADHVAVLQLQEKRAYLGRVVRTAIADVDEHSTLCQSWSRRRVVRKGAAPEAGADTEQWEVTEIRMPDKLKAIELDSRLSGELDGRSANPIASDGLAELLGMIRAGR